MEREIYELYPQYDKRQSFYHKAYVVIENGIRMLYSYGTLVAKIYEGQAVVLNDAFCSITTFRHVKEFLKQNSFTAENRKQVARDYM